MSATADDLSEEVARLGPPEAELKASAAHAVLYLVAGVVFLVLGTGILAGLVGWVWLGDGWKVRSARAIVQLTVGGVALLGAGLGTLRRGRAARGLRVIVCADGIARLQGND